MQTPTRILHEGDDPETRLGAVNPPIYHASTFTFPTMQTFLDGMAGQGERYIYSRNGNPTVAALEQKLAMLEGADHAIATASGMGAITAAILASVTGGEHALVVDSCYGPTRRFMDEVMAPLGVETTYYHPLVDDLALLWRPNTRLVYLESPGSLCFHIQDVARLAAQARERGATTLIDNTWATPLYQQPHSLGVDLVVHTGSKYLGGHSDVVMGVVTCAQDRYPPLRGVASLLGATLGPAEAYLVLRALRTLPLRLAQHQAGALSVARWLQAQPQVRRVLHPGLPDFPRHDLARRQMSGWSGLFSFELHPPAMPAQRHRFVDALQLFGIGVSWGGYESLIIPLLAQDPVIAARHARLGLSDDCYRVSIGLEAPEDLMADLARGLGAYEMDRQQE